MAYQISIYAGSAVQGQNSNPRKNRLHFYPMEQEARAAIRDIIQGWYTDFAPTRAADLQPITSGNGWNTVDTSANESDVPPTDVLTCFVFPPGQWTHVVRMVEKSDSQVIFAAEFSQPTRRRPVPAATAQVRMTYRVPTAAVPFPSVRVQLEAQSHAFVLVPDFKLKGTWVRAEDPDKKNGKVNVFKWFTEIIRCKAMMHEDGMYASMRKHVFAV